MYVRVYICIYIIARKIKQSFLYMKNMSLLVMNKQLLCLLIICANFFSIALGGCAVFARSWNLNILNGIPPNTSITIHVMSNEDDFGYHNITYKGQEYFLHFCENIFHHTVFRSDFWFGDRRGFLFVFDDKVAGQFDLIDAQNIFWLVKDDGFYLSGKRDKGYKFWAKW